MNNSVSFSLVQHFHRRSEQLLVVHFCFSLAQGGRDELLLVLLGSAADDINSSSLIILSNKNTIRGMAQNIQYKNILPVVAEHLLGTTTILRFRDASIQATPCFHIVVIF